MVMIGDNLASHFSDRAIEVCNSEGIEFACLQSNSTHICQPLDVFFFKPMKVAWRSILIVYKMKHLKILGIPKDTFPSLPKQWLENMDKIQARTEHKNGDCEAGAIRRRIKNGFEACGIFPFNPVKVLTKITPVVAAEDVCQ